MNRYDFDSVARWTLATRTRTWVTVALGWSLVGFLSAAHWQLFFLGESPYTWWQLLRIKLVLWYLWGGFTFLIVLVGRRFRPEGSRVWSRWWVLIGFSILIVSAYLALYAVAIWSHLRWMGADAPLAYYFKFVLDHHSTFYYLAFWATLGIAYALEFARRYREREHLASQLQVQLSEARLHTLQARLQPHFLFNALNTIASMVHERRADAAYDVLTRLSDLLRESLRQSHLQTIPLARELELVRHYLEIARARFPDRLTFRLESDRALDGLAVPTFILQPLVENAVLHGLKDLDVRLNLVVACRRENGTLQLSVEDNGPGLPADFDFDSSRGFGLSSTKARLSTLYGREAQFTITPNTPTGVLARLSLPSSEEPKTATP
jgi:two-component system LytT family sensor kinase